MSRNTIFGNIPYRLALAGGWIDQPFVSRHNPTPPGSMVVISLKPDFYFMDRCGMGTSTRKVAMRIWNGEMPERDPDSLVRELYAEENKGQKEPSGSQDMAGIVYPGVSRLDYDAEFQGGYFPVQVESNNDLAVAVWLEHVINLLPVTQRPSGYNPLGIKNLNESWIQRLGDTGNSCYEAIVAKDIRLFGEALNECIRCWEIILPQTLRHPTLSVDLASLLSYYQKRYPGAMYSGCGGGYLVVVSEEPVPGALKIRVRTKIQAEQ